VDLPGVKFYENYGELTADDVKFTIEQNLKPSVPGSTRGPGSGSSPKPIAP